MVVKSCPRIIREFVSKNAMQSGKIVLNAKRYAFFELIYYGRSAMPFERVLLELWERTNLLEGYNWIMHVIIEHLT